MAVWGDLLLADAPMILGAESLPTGMQCQVTIAK